MITQDRLKELLDYSETTGDFTWKESRGRVSKGTKAGTLDKDGYIIIRVDRHNYRAHRL